MVWLLGGLVLVVVVVLDRRQERRDRDERERAGVPTRRLQPERGVGYLGEAPFGTHHRLGGRARQD